MVLFSGSRLVVLSRGVAAAAAMFLLVLPSLHAQLPTQGRLQASRAELEAELARVGRSDAPQAERIRQRLQQGDFKLNDRVYVSVFGEPQLTDSFTVRAGPQLELPNLPAPLSLVGVLRSEVQERVREHVARYIKDPQVSARALIRIGITGGVLRPGFYNVPADLDLSQVIMAAGGFSNESEIKKSTIQRDGSVLYDATAVQAAFGKGQSPDQLNLQSGDALDVGRRVPGHAAQTIGIFTGLAGLVTTLILVLR